MDDQLYLHTARGEVQVATDRDASGVHTLIQASKAGATRVDSTSPGVTYVGKAAIGASTAAAVWQIKRVETPTDETIVSFADGNTSFDNVWDNRAALAYS